MDMETVARFVVGASAASLLVIGLGVLVWEAVRHRAEPVERYEGPLAAVNFVGILGFVAVGLGTAITTAGTLGQIPNPAGTVVRAVGVAVTIAAGLLAVWGLRSIGRDMASQAEVLADSQLVTTGAFALVRHPLYLSIILLWAGSAAALLSWVLAICTVALTPLFASRSRLEERLLTEHFGDAYRRYAARVPMLIPFTRPR